MHIPLHCSQVSCGCPVWTCTGLFHAIIFAIIFPSSVVSVIDWALWTYLGDFRIPFSPFFSWVKQFIHLVNGSSLVRLTLLTTGIQGFQSQWLEIIDPFFLIQWTTSLICSFCSLLSALSFNIVCIWLYMYVYVEMVRVTVPGDGGWRLNKNFYFLIKDH